MKISYNWLKDYIKCDLAPEQVAEILTSIGLEVESVEKVESIPGGLRGVVVGHVVSCERHPDADRLSLTKVDVGGEEALSIVCGAPNVAQGQKVLVATIGTTLHTNSGEKLTIKKGNIRGQESHGMICAEDELGLGDSHAGIMVLPQDTEIGLAAATYFDIQEDYCLEIGLTPNRTDAFSHFGVARDLFAAITNAHQLSVSRKAELVNPYGTHSKHSADVDQVSVSVADGEACPRYCGVVINHITVAPSPKWMQDRLKTIGLKPINNVVDITNYIQHAIGQPLHAFDLKQIEGRQVIVRKAAQGEILITLDRVERKLSTDDLVICDAQKPMCIAGVFGGLNSGVNEQTTSIFLESAYFNPVSVRKTARRHGLNTDSSFRFERGVDPENVLNALHTAVIMISELCTESKAGGPLDIYPMPIARKVVDFDMQRANVLIGKKLEPNVYSAIFRDLDIEAEPIDDSKYKLRIPLYRSDVTRQADVVEEVLRIYGYNHVEIPSRLHASLSESTFPDPEKLQNAIADHLVASSFTEIMCMSLSSAKYTELAFSPDPQSAVHLLNPLSNELSVLRQSLLPSGLETISRNQNHRHTDLRLFEFGKTYSKTEKGYAEDLRLSLFTTGRLMPENWNNDQKSQSFFELFASVKSIFAQLRLHSLQYTPNESEIYAEGLNLSVNGKPVGTIGSLHQNVLNAFDIKQPVFFADLDWQLMLKLISSKKPIYKEAPKYPSVRRDLSLLLDKSVTFEQIATHAKQAEKKYLVDVGLFDVYEGKNLEAGKKSYAIKFTLLDVEKTMTDKQVDGIMTKILERLQQQLGAVLRG